MRKRLTAVSAAAMLALPYCAHALVPVEQIEAGVANYNVSPPAYSVYAPVEFGGNSSVVGGGVFTGITFHAVDTANDTSTAYQHAYDVAQRMYGSSTVAYPYVTNVYNLEAEDFLDNTIKTRAATGQGVLPGSFATGVQVVNDSWDGSYDQTQYPGANLDALRRFDFMVNRADVLSVAGVDGPGKTVPLLWSAYNTLAVSGTTTFSPSGSATKQHADLYFNDLASYGSGFTSGYGTALYGVAQAAGQLSAEHSYVMRSLLLAGTVKTDPYSGSSIYTHPAPGSGGLDPIYGAGTPVYDNSQAILQGGPQNLVTVGAGGTINGTPATVQKGWATNNVSAGSQAVVLIQSANALTGVTASLNWNVTSQSDANSINTSNGSVIFPNLGFEVRPVTYSGGGQFTLGAAESNLIFSSNVTGDNTQYIYSTIGLPAGTYALVVTDNSSLPATVGLSYTLAGSFASRWNISSGGSWGNSANWSSGIPNGQAAQANLLASPGITTPATITLDGDRTVGQLTFNNSNGYTIARGMIPNGLTGSLSIDDTGDSTGLSNPLIAVQAGNHMISAPVILVNGLTSNISNGSALTISGVMSGNGGLTKIGAGTLTLSASDSYCISTLNGINTPNGSTSINAGTLILTATGSINSGPININAAGTFDLAASTTTGILTRNITGAINVNASGKVVVAPSSVTANRQLLVTTGGLSIAGSADSWTGKLDLNNNDADIPSGNLADVTNQIKQGYRGGNWNGTGGIISTFAGNNPTHLTTLGIILNNTDRSTPLYGAGKGLGLFDGISPAASDVLIKYTYYGDANLDGIVDASDYSRIDNGSLMHLTGWYNGDFNYDGVVDGSDYTLIDNAFNTQAATLAASVASSVASVAPQIGDTSAVPEPAALALLTISAVGLLGRRRRL